MDTIADKTKMAAMADSSAGDPSGSGGSKDSLARSARVA